MFDPGDWDDRASDDRGAETLRHRYDWDAVRASTAVVEMVAIAADEEPSSLDPLYHAVDPEALDLLVRREGDEDRNGNGNGGVATVVAFTYAGFDVTVRSDGVLTVAPDRSVPAGE